MSGERAEILEPVVVCLGGMVSRLCSLSIDVVLDDFTKLVDAVDRVWEEEPRRPVLFVASGLRGFSGLLRELGELGRNPFLVEATGIPETMLSGLSMDKLIEYYGGFMVATMGDRLRAVKRRPAVTRRELFRRLFLVTPEYIIPPPEGVERCRGRCPLGAVGERGLDTSRCRGCMVCIHGCTAPPQWAGVAGLAYAYRYVEENGLDGILFLCRERLDDLDEKAVEASPAKLLLFHLPCAGWLSPGLVRALVELGVYVHVYAGPRVCSGCPRWEALHASQHLEALRRAGAVVSENLSEASMHAYEGYTRPKRSLEEVVKKLEAAARETG
jgi:ferredoxin